MEKRVPALGRCRVSLVSITRACRSKCEILNASRSNEDQLATRSSGVWYNDAGKLQLCRHPSIRLSSCVANMATADPSESPAPVEATKGNGTPSGQDTIKDEQWRAMKRVIDSIYEYRQPE